MSRRAPDRAPDAATLARLDRLRAVARIKADAALSRLAVSAQGRARLIQSIEALGRAEAPLAGPEAAAEGTPAAAAAADDPALVQARLAHRRWLDAQRRMLNQRLALVEAEYLTLRPEAQRAFGRAEVLDRLRGDLGTEFRRCAGRDDAGG